MKNKLIFQPKKQNAIHSQTHAILNDKKDIDIKIEIQYLKELKDLTQIGRSSKPEHVYHSRRSSKY